MDVGAAGIFHTRQYFTSISFQEAMAAKADAKEQEAIDLAERKAAREAKACDKAAEKARKSAAFSSVQPCRVRVSPRWRSRKAIRLETAAP